MSAPSLPSAVAAVLSADAVLAALGARADGLASADVPARRRAAGRNELAEEEPETMRAKFVQKLREPMIAMLLCSAVISLFMGQYDDCVSISLVRGRERAERRRAALLRRQPLTRPPPPPPSSRSL